MSLVKNALLIFFLLTLAPAGLLPTVALAQQADNAAPDKYVGTYRIVNWASLQSSGMHHFFYLHPEGSFLLGAEWPGMENSIISGTWSVSGELLYLNGKADVRTNQGDWVVPFQRTFTIHVGEKGFRLIPKPEKNRYGLLGWPNAFEFHRRDPDPNLPGREIPKDEAALAAMILELSAN